MPVTGQSEGHVGEALAEYVARGLFDATHGADSDLEEGDPEGLVRDVHVYSQLWFSEEGHDDLDQGIAQLPLEFFDFEYDAARWHSNTIDPSIIARAHILRLAHGWTGETTLHTYLKKKPMLITALGFESLPDQSTLNRAWKKFSPEHQHAIEDAAREVVGIARYYDVPAPAKPFQPEQEREDGDENPSKRGLTVKRTKEIWGYGKRHICDGYDLDRAPQYQIPESRFWQQQAFAGLLDDSCIQDGARSADYEIEDAPSGWTHREQVQKMDIEDIREMHRNVAESLIKMGRQRSHFDRGVTVAIDGTKSPREFQGHIDRDEDGNNQEPWILGYKDEGPRYQWAAVQIVEGGLPIVLDVVPVKRGMKRYDIVDELLSEAKDLIRIDEVQVDREFDNDDVRGVVADHGMTFRMPAMKNASIRGTCTDLRRQGASAHIIEDGGLGGPSWKTLFVPATNTEVHKPVEGDLDTEEDDEDELTIQEELLDDFGEMTDTGEEEGRRMFEDFLDGLHEEEEKQPIRGSDADVDSYAIFRTNDPAASGADLEDEKDVIEVAERAVRKYRARWAIEEGFKKIKQFMVLTTSRDHEYRFFNFAFAASLNNIWRMVDLLVQLSLGREYDGSPFVTAQEFLACAKNHFDLDTPPPPLEFGAV